RGHDGRAERREANGGGRVHAAQAQDQGGYGERDARCYRLADRPGQLRGHDDPPDGRAARTRGTPARRLCWPKVSPTLGLALPPEGRGALSMSTTGCRTTPLQTLKFYRSFC